MTATNHFFFICCILSYKYDLFTYSPCADYEQSYTLYAVFNRIDFIKSTKFSLTLFKVNFKHIHLKYIFCTYLQYTYFIRNTKIKMKERIKERKKENNKKHY